MHAVVFVVDSTSKDVNDETKEYLFDLLKEGLDGVPLLVMANKQDEPNARSKEVITEELELSKITNRQWSKLDDQIHLILTPLCVKRRKKSTSLNLSTSCLIRQALPCQINNHPIDEIPDHAT